MSSCIRVLVLGTPPNSDKALFTGTAVFTHKAWNKTYTFSHTEAAGVHTAARDAVLLCDIIVLCKGSRLPQNASNYINRPVLALPDAPPDCLAQLSKQPFYYGTCPVKDLRERVLTLALAPPHILYDAKLQRLTEVGESALRRAFWLYDRDADGVLRFEELLQWRRQVESAAYEEEELISFLKDWGDEVAATRQAKLVQFIDLHERWISDGAVVQAWATLHSVGVHPDGKPYSREELSSLKTRVELNTYLSPHAIQFFTNVYKLRRFGEKASIWDLTPGCPWTGVDGFLQESIPIDKFIEYWKFMALTQRDDLVRCARCWGYKGDVSYLFTRRYARSYRSDAESVPNTIHVLVLGSMHSGRRSLIYALTCSDLESYRGPDKFARLYCRTTTFFAAKGRGAAEEAQTVIYSAIPPEDVGAVLADPQSSKLYDVVLLCYDGGHIQTSTEFVIEAHTTARHQKAFSRTPFIVVMTKADVNAAEDPTVQAATNRLQQYCKANQLLWPPVMTSSEQPDQSEVASINEYMYGVSADPSLAIGNPPLTLVRILRRTTFVAILAIATAGIAQTLVNLVRRRRQ